MCCNRCGPQARLGVQGWEHAAAGAGQARLMLGALSWAIACPAQSIYAARWAEGDEGGFTPGKSRARAACRPARICDQLAGCLPSSLQVRSPLLLRPAWPHPVGRPCRQPLPLIGPLIRCSIAVLLIASPTAPRKPPSADEARPPGAGGPLAPIRPPHTALETAPRAHSRPQQHAGAACSPAGRRRQRQGGQPPSGCAGGRERPPARAGEAAACWAVS